MKIVVAVIIYNRFHNLKRWAECWPLCDKENAELRVIHNYEKEEDIEIYRNYCERHGITYIPRPNLGLDIGALQDVCRERLNGFDNEYDYLLWSTDDTLPMTKDFIGTYLRKLENTNVICTEISDEVTRHIRTTGIMAKKEVWTQLQFPSDPLTDKSETYDFEHRGGDKTMMIQFDKLGITYCQVSDDVRLAPMWDIDKRESFGRWAEYYSIFPEAKKVVFIATIYNTFPEIVSSLICQTYKDWELVLIHDGANHTQLKKYIDAVNDSRITYIEKPDRLQQYGHPHRQWALNELSVGRLSDAQYVVVTNADNYMAPVFIEYMLKPFENKDVIATYCGEMSHSYWRANHADEKSNLWGSGKCSLRRGQVDCGGVMVRREAVSVGWNDMSHSSDWTYFESIINKYGVDKWVKVPGLIFIHN